MPSAKATRTLFPTHNTKERPPVASLRMQRNAAECNTMAERIEKLTRRQEQALAALLTEPTMSAAAEKAGLNRCTLTRWLQDPAFQAAYAAVRHRAVDHALAKLQAGLALAVQTLAEAMADKELPAGDRIRAASDFIKHALKAVETLDIMARLAAVEERLDRYEQEDATPKA